MSKLYISEITSDNPKSRIEELTRFEKLALGHIGRRKRNYGHKFSPNLLRLREIEKIITSRHGQFIPHTDDAVIYIEAAILALSGQDMWHWCRRWAPWAIQRFDGIVAPLLNRHATRRWLQSANDCAKLLQVTLAERTALGLHTIGACDVSADERKEIAKDAKRERDRTRQAQKRKAAGMKDRASYEAESLSRTKPWEAEGICRRTWERCRVASVSPVESTGKEGDTLAAFIQKAQPVPPSPLTKDVKSNGAEAARASGERWPSGPPQGAASSSTVPPAPRLALEFKKAG